MSDNYICPICNSVDTSVIHDKIRLNKTRNVIRCSECELIFLDGIADAREAYIEYYKKEYRKDFGSDLRQSSGTDPKKYFEDKLPLQKERLDRLNKKTFEKKDVLEIGCGAGSFLYQIKDVAKSVEGIELDPGHTAFINENLGITAYNEDIFNVDFGKQYDIIAMFHVLEHIPKPDFFLEKVFSLLKSSGQVIVEVPNANDPLLSFFDIEKFKSFYFQEPHLYYFNEKSLTRLMDNLEFPVKCEFNSFNQYGFTNHMSWFFTSVSNCSRRADADDTGNLKNDVGHVEAYKELSDCYDRILGKYNMYDTLLVSLSRE